MKIGNIFGTLCIIILVTFCIWFVASWADTIINPLRQYWNMFDIIFKIAGIEI